MYGPFMSGEVVSHVRKLWNEQYVRMKARQLSHKDQMFPTDREEKKMLAKQ